MECHDEGIFPLLRHLAPPLEIQTTISSSPPSQSGITVEGNLERLNGDSVRSDSLSVRQRADGACQLLHRGLDSKRHVLGPLIADEFNVRSGVRHPRLLTYAELRSRFPSRTIVFRCLKKPAWSLSRARVSSFSRTKSQKKAQHCSLANLLKTFFWPATFTAFRRFCCYVQIPPF